MSMVTKILEKCMSDLEEMVGEIPRLLNLRFEFVRAQLDWRRDAWPPSRPKPTHAWSPWRPKSTRCTAFLQKCSTSAPSAGG